MVKGQVVVLQAPAVLVEHQDQVMARLADLVIQEANMVEAVAVNPTIVETLQAVKVQLAQ